jgi:hypothetical protein
MTASLIACAATSARSSRSRAAKTATLSTCAEEAKIERLQYEIEQLRFGFSDA